MRIILRKIAPGEVSVSLSPGAIVRVEDGFVPSSGWRLIYFPLLGLP